MTWTRIVRNLVSAIAACALLFMSAVRPALACTGIRLTAEDGAVVHARTLEFAIDLHSDIMMVPRGYARTGTTPDGKEGLKWKAKYASGTQQTDDSFRPFSVGPRSMPAFAENDQQMGGCRALEVYH